MRVFFGIYLLVVFVPLSTIAVWAFVDRWPWPNLLPSALSTRGLAEIFNGHAPIGGVLARSILIAVAVSVLCIVIASLSARALVFYEFLGKDLFRFATILPFIVPAAVFAMGIQVAFLRVGLGGTMLGVIIAHTVVALPYAIGIMTDVMAAAGPRLEEQSRVLGASRRQTLVHVTVPSLLPGILASASMAYIVSFSQYFLTLLVGGGSMKTFAVVMFPFLSSGDRTIAASYSLVFLVSTFAVFLLFEWILKKLGMRETRSLFL
ncbi:MAG: ABC transporter permease subunit [Coriobacteriia bacterium]|nr:ABC transporter permease subunit [Coriobacteriia bacterium]